MEEAEEPGGGKLQEDTGQFGLGSRTSVRTSVHEARDAQDELLRNELKGAKFRLVLSRRQWSRAAIEEFDSTLLVS